MGAERGDRPSDTVVGGGGEGSFREILIKPFRGHHGRVRPSLEAPCTVHPRKAEVGWGCKWPTCRQA